MKTSGGYTSGTRWPAAAQGAKGDWLPPSPLVPDCYAALPSLAVSR